jgi:hypothetical protein
MRVHAGKLMHPVAARRLGKHGIDVRCRQVEPCGLASGHISPFDQDFIRRRAFCLRRRRPYLESFDRAARQGDTGIGGKAPCRAVFTPSVRRVDRESSQDQSGLPGSTLLQQSSKLGVA